MEVVTIEKRTFSYVCERFTEFAIESLCSTHIQKVENWLDSQEVCLLLGFSKRTLQYYRSSGRHLMPLLQMPHPHNDGGYAVEDFDTVDPALGTNKDQIGRAHV